MPEYARESNFYRMHKTPLLEGLNEAQCEAVMHGEGPALVAAGPGSGKTTVLIRRILYLMLVRKVPAQKILVITYTKEAALSMQERFRQELKIFNRNNMSFHGQVNFGTFHSYFYQIVRSIKKYSDYQLITQQEKNKIVSNILKKDGEAPSDFAIRRFLEQVSFYKNTGKQKDEWDIPNAYQRYEETMHMYKRMDFDDMLYLCKKELQSDNVLLQRCKERFDYFMIDEFQDINPIQYELMRMFFDKNENLFVVGDDDQAIYGFRGTDGECFQKMKQDYTKIKTIYLSVNYRCSENIVKSSECLISKNTNRLEKKIVSGRKGKSNGEIILRTSMHNTESYEKLIEILKTKTLSELNCEAVLFRTNAALQSFANKLSTVGIPFILREKIRSVYEHFIAMDIFDYYAAANGCNDRKLYLRIFQKYKIFNGREVLKTEKVDIKEVKKLLGSGFYENTHILNKVENLERQLLQLKRMRPGLGIRYILHGMNYEKYLIGKAGNNTKIPEEWQEVLEWLQEEAENYSDYASWMEQKEYDLENMERAMLRVKEQSQGIYLMTMHASKGLEFDKVYIMNLNEGTMPKFKKGGEITKEAIEEERRLFYVALTRARYSVELYYITGTKENPRLKSRFLDEIK